MSADVSDVKARTDKLCDTCHRYIRKGEQYRRETFGNGRPTRIRAEHWECYHKRKA